MTKLHSIKVNFHQNELIMDLTRYDLVAVVIHCGSGPNRFVSVKSYLRNTQMQRNGRFVVILFSQRPLHLNREVPWILAHLRRRHRGQNRPRHNRRLLRADSRHTEVLRDRLHPFLPVPGPFVPVIVAFSPM